MNVVRGGLFVAGSIAAVVGGLALGKKLKKEHMQPEGAELPALEAGPGADSFIKS